MRRLDEVEPAHVAAGEQGRRRDLVEGSVKIKVAHVSLLFTRLSPGPIASA